MSSPNIPLDWIFTRDIRSYCHSQEESWKNIYRLVLTVVGHEESKIIKGIRFKELQINSLADTTIRQS